MPRRVSAIGVLSLGVLAIALSQAPEPAVTLTPATVVAAAGETVEYETTITNPNDAVQHPVAVVWDYAMDDGTYGEVVRAATIIEPHNMVAAATVTLPPGVGYVLGSATLNGVAVAPQVDIDEETEVSSIRVPVGPIAAGETAVLRFRAEVGGGVVLPPAPPQL